MSTYWGYLWCGMLRKINQGDRVWTGLCASGQGPLEVRHAPGGSARLKRTYGSISRAGGVLFFQVNGGLTMYGCGGDSWGMTGWIAMAVLMVLFWGGVITVIVILLRRPHSGQGTPGMRPSHDEAERILHERFACGEIEESEYLARRAALRRPE